MKNKNEMKELLENHNHYDVYMLGEEGYLENGDLIEYFENHVVINDKEYSKYVNCPICDKKMRWVSNTHLWRSHSMTIDEFKKLYPDTKLKSEFSVYLTSYKMKGKTYEEIHGADKALELKKKRKKAALKQFEDPEQRKVRSEKCFKEEKTNEDIEKFLESKFGDIDVGYREKALSFYGEECQSCGEDDITKLHVHHKDCAHYGNGNVFNNHDIENLQVLCRSCHRKLHNKGNAFGSNKFLGKSKIEAGFATIIDGLYTAYGLDKKDINFKDTPSRVARAYMEMLQGIDPTQIDDILSKNFPNDYDGMVVANNIECYSMCPHHFLPVKYDIDFAYIPDGKVLGLSKIGRYIKLMAQAPILQEYFTKEIINRFGDIVKPIGAIVVVKGKHMCMGARGLEMPGSVVITSSLSGVFNEKSVKDEFYHMIKR